MAIMLSRIAIRLTATVCFLALTSVVAAQETGKQFEPVSGQAGKDVVWVPTPEVTVEKMAGVAEKALFVQGDMYEADISKASVMALFLLPDNMNKLLPRFLALKPGSRIVSNSFSMEGWTADHTETLPDCSAWCTVLLWVVPANAAGVWQLPQGTLTLKQEFQHVAGTLGTTAIADGRLNGEQITFTAGTARYAGRVNGDVIDGTVTTGTDTAAWRATRAATPTGPSRE